MQQGLRQEKKVNRGVRRRLGSLASREGKASSFLPFPLLPPGFSTDPSLPRFCPPAPTLIPGSPPGGSSAAAPRALGPSSIPCRHLRPYYPNLRKLNRVEPGQYLVGSPPGNTRGGRLLSFCFVPLSLFCLWASKLPLDASLPFSCPPASLLQPKTASWWPAAAAPRVFGTARCPLWCVGPYHPEL